MKQKLQYIAIVCLAAIVGFVASVAYADGSDSMQKMITTPLPSSKAEATDNEDNSVIRLTPDSSKIIHLEQDAASVIVNNPKNVGVVLDNPRLLVVMPKEPGTTSFTVLDASGKTILQSRVIVTGTQQKYIRVRRMCTTADCVQSSYFYCPDGCYEVNPVPGAEGTATIPDVQGAPAGAAAEPIAHGVAPAQTGLTPSEQPADAAIPVIPPAKEPQ